MDAQMVFTAFKISLVRNKNLEGLTVSPMIELRKQINTEQSKFGGATLSLSACSVYHVSWLFHSQNSCLAKKVKVKSLSHVQLLGTPRTVAYLLLHPPCSSVHGIFQARVPEWVAISFSRGSSWPRDRTQVSRTVGRHITIWATREILRKRITVKTQSEKRVSPDLHRSLLPFFYSPPFPLLLHEGTELTMGKPE